MLENSRILLFKDRPDYIKKVTDDEIINVTGCVGSGKSTFGIKYHNNSDYVVIGFDSLSEDRDPYTLNSDVLELRNILLAKYGAITEDEPFYYDDMVQFIRDKQKKGIIEGGHLTHMEIEKLEGTIIVKRTARLKCYFRSAWRDFNNPVRRQNKNFCGLVQLFFHCYGRLGRIFPQKYMEEFIEKLESYD